MKRNILFKNIALLVVIFVMGGICTISLKSFYRGSIIELLSNDLYRSDMTHCVQINDIELSDLLYISNDTFISKTLSENMRGLYFTSKYKYNLPVIEGRFFNYNDFKKNNNYVVVGQNLKHGLYKENNKLYYNYFDKKYEVIGIVGFDIDSKLNDIVFFNLVNIFEQSPQKTDIIIGLNYKKIANNMKQLHLEDTIKLLDIPYMGVSRIWSTPNIYIIITYTTYLCCLLAVLFLIYLKSYYYKNYIKTFRILGFKKIFIYKNIFIWECFLYCVAFGIGVICTVYIFVEKYYISKDFMMSILSLSFINCCILVFFNLLLLNNKIREYTGRRNYKNA